MAVSAFKSTSRRGNYNNASTSSSSSSISTTSRDQVSRDSLKKTPIRRSRSVSAVQRSQLLHEGYGNTRDNPLFDCSSGSSKSSSNERENLGIGKGRGDSVSTDKRGRMGRALDSAIGKPRERSPSRVDPARRRLRSVSRGPSKSNESDYPSTDTDEGKIYETVRSEVQRAVSQIRDDLENVIKGRSTTDMVSDLDGAEIASDIRTDYTSKLEQSQERIRKLRAELVVEEQRKEELSKILKEFLSSPDSQSCKARSTRRTSIERREVSRRLEEEAMSYFEECVSISNFDGSDFSSLEDPLPSSTACRQTLENDVFLSNEDIAFAESLISNNYEESEKQSPRSISLTGSGMAFSHSSSYTKYPNPKLIYHGSDLISDFDTSESFHFSFTQQPEKQNENRKGENYLGSFGKGCDEEKLACLKITRTRYYADDYISKDLDESLFKDVVMLKNRLNSGGLLLCNIRTF